MKHSEKQQKILLVLLCLVGAFTHSASASDQEKPSTRLNTPPVVNSDIKKPAGISNLDTATVNQMRAALKAKEIDYPKYRDAVKAHNDKVADLNVVRRKSNARVRTTLRSQNNQWRGSYDCDDTQLNVNPGQSEACDGIDNDCDGEIDEGVTANLFLDADGDGWGDPGKPIQACNVEAGYAARGQDCDDKNIQIYPGAADAEGDGIDANCDGQDG